MKRVFKPITNCGTTDKIPMVPQPTGRTNYCFRTGYEELLGPGRIADTQLLLKALI